MTRDKLFRYKNHIRRITLQSMNELSLELTILMPCLNEEETLGICIDKAQGYLKKYNIEGEVLIADNGSTDNSIEIAQQKGARVVRVEEKGYGAALKGGINAAQGKFIIMGDADDSYDFINLQKFLDKLREGNDLVMGNRFKGGVAKGAMPFLHKYLGNPVLSFLGRLFFKIPVGDFHCGLRGFHREKILSLGLHTSGMEFASEMVVSSALNKLQISEVPTTLSPDGRSSAPHLNTWGDGWRHLRFLLMYSPRWLFLYPSLIVLAFGSMLTAALFSGPVNVFPGVYLDVHSSVLASFTVLVGAQGVFLSIVIRRYAALKGFLPENEKHSWLFELITLEKVIVIAAVLFVGGVLGITHGISVWLTADFGALEYGSLVRVLMISGTAIVLAIQSLFTAFFAEIINIKTNG